MRGEYVESISHYEQEKIKELLIGHQVSKVEDHVLELDNGVRLRFPDTDGGCACSAGCYDLTELNGTDNIITNVDFENDPDDDSQWERDTRGSYKIFVIAANKKVNLATWQGSDGNGYYGTGYDIHVLGVAD